jgi:2-succinyl-6-hydroxy-2,4-cyclohexadiene-1-carboxylate synthase
MPTINLCGSPCDYDLTPAKPGSPVLVFVHGWLLSRAYWQPLVALLSPHYQCLTYDLRGFGRSAPIEKDTPGYALADYADELVLLLDRLNIDRAWLVGHSLGGSIALWAADQCPDRIAGVVGVNAGGGIYLETEFGRFRQAGQQLLKFRPNWLRYVPFVDVIFGRMAVTQPIERQWGRQRLIDFLAADAEAAKQSLLASTTQAEVHQLPQLVARLVQPAYFIAGAEDRIMEPKYVRHLASFHPLFQQQGLNLVELANCGHLAMLEQTAPVAAQIERMVQGKVLSEASGAMIEA